MDTYAFTRTAVTKAYVTNGLNQYSTITQGSTFTNCYDLNGNLTSDGVSVFLYDVENRLVEKRVQGAGNSNCAALSYTGQLQASLRYDPMGRLYETAVNPATPATITRFLIDGDAMVAEFDSTGGMLRRYVHGADGKADDPIAWYEGASMANGAVRYLYANHQGSLILAADAAGGSASQFKYDEYGNTQMASGIVGCTGSTAPSLTCGGRFLYTGQMLVPELAMYYYKARVYSPALGRFMQVDPIGYKDQNNLYGYVGNDPVNKTDPTGMYECNGLPDLCKAVAKAYYTASQALLQRNLSRTQRNQIESSLAALGAPGRKNGVTVSFASSQQISNRVGSGFAYTEKTSRSINVVLPNTYDRSFNGWGPSNSGSPLAGRPGRFSAENARSNALMHEGAHVSQFKSGLTQEQYSRNPNPYEIEAYRTGNAVDRAYGTISAFPEP